MVYITFINLLSICGNFIRGKCKLLIIPFPELQSLAAEMLGKEAALFVPSGTMSNLIALLVHCKGRGSEAIVGDQSHILHYEQNGAAQVYIQMEMPF